LHMRVGPPRGWGSCLKQWLTSYRGENPGKWLAGFVCVAILLAVGCSRPVKSSPPVTIEHEISPQPLRVGSATVTLTLKDATGKLMTGAIITVEADMTHAGMRPAFAEAKEIRAGHYEAPVEFQMAGDWVILLHLALPDGKKLEQQFDVRGVRPN
jgi:hypothetical protein